MIAKIRKLENIYIYILFIYIFTLPIAKITAIQNSLFAIFIFVFVFVNYKNFDFSQISRIKEFFIFFAILFFLAICSLFDTVNFRETFNEIRSEFLKPFIYFLLMYLLVNLSDKRNMIKIFFLLGFVLIFHTILNIVIWIDNGGWPSRTGGLLDGTIVSLNIFTAGERFGIWATYSLAFSVSILFTRYKRIAYILILLSLISIIANHTRATFISTIFIFLAYLIFFYKNKLIKFSSLFLFISSLICFIFYSKNLEERFNVYNMINSLKYLNDYAPSEFKILEDNFELGHSTVSRLAMWKSVILYRTDNPFIPQSYGRFLYGESLKENYKNNQENIPYVVYSQAHNDFISILYSLGVIGLLFFILLLVYVLKTSYELTLTNYRVFGIFVFLGTLGYIGSMLFGSFFGDTEQLFFYLLLGAMLSIYTKNEKEKYEKTKLN